MTLECGNEYMNMCKCNPEFLLFLKSERSSN